MTYFPNSAMISTANSSTSILTAGSTFTGTGELNYYPDVIVHLKTDQNGTLYCDFSIDGSNWDSTLSFAVLAGVNEIHKLVKGNRYFRLRFTNTSASDQTYFRLQVSYGNFFVLTSSLNSSIAPDADAVITRAITEEVAVAEGKYTDRFIVTKFARNSDVDAAEDIWNGGGNYTGFPSGSAETLTILSSSANDTSGGTGARTLRVFGLDSDYNLQQEDVTLNGTTGVATSNSYKRVYRAYILTSGSGTTNAGEITIRHTTTTANVFAVMPTGFGQTQIANYTIPANHTGYLKRYSASINDNTSNRAEMVIKRVDQNGTIRYFRPFIVSDVSPITREVYGGLVFEEKTDITFRALSVTNTNADITVSWDMMVVKNQS